MKKMLNGYSLKDGDLINCLDAQRWFQVHCEAVEVFEDLPPVYRWIELLW